MPFTIIDLPFAPNALAPLISEETINFHYGKHHQTYADNLNRLTANNEWADKALIEVVQSSSGAIFNNAAQVWNHDFYWQCLSPQTSTKPNKLVLAAIDAAFGDFASFKEQFTATAIATFGSGWAWLIINANNSLEIVSTSNADNPLAAGLTPLLTCDVWEHAYYIDYRNARPKYIDAYWELVNWDFVATNLA